MESVPNCRKEIAVRYPIRWFKCKLKPPKKKRNQIHIDRYLLRLERAILLGRLTVLEQELDREVCVLECQVGRVYLQWWLENVRGPVIRRLLELNRQLGINVPLIFRRI